MFIWPPFLINLFSSVPSVEILAAAHPALGCDHGVISQNLVPRKEEGLSKKIPPWDATETTHSDAMEAEVERGVIKCPLHFLQEALAAFITLPATQLYYSNYVYPLRHPTPCTPQGLRYQKTNAHIEWRVSILVPLINLRLVHNSKIRTYLPRVGVGFWLLTLHCTVMLHTLSKYLLWII